MLWGDYLNKDVSELIRRTVETKNAPKAIGPVPGGAGRRNTLFGRTGRVGSAIGELVSDSLLLQVWQGWII